MRIPIDFLESVAYRLRKSVIAMPTYAGSGHPTTCLSSVDIATVLFWAVMRYDPQDFNNPDSDRFILSKGHASALLYAIWHELGIIPEAELHTYRQFNSVLEGHPTFRFSHTEAATGSLGIGLSIGAGQALAAKLDGRDYNVYVLMGDGEIAEGSVWEAAQFASYHKLNNLVAIVDCNGLGQSARVMLDGDIELYARRFASFGFTPYIVDGHNINALRAAFEERTHDTPVVILAPTHKGYGVDFAEDKEGMHGVAFDRAQLAQALGSIEKKFYAAAHYSGNFVWKPTLPAHTVATQPALEQKKVGAVYTQSKPIATRTAFGDALVELGAQHPELVALDGDVQNSTMTQLFAKKYPERFVQCFIAEQNMISVAVGLQLRGKVPYAATFGAFLTRAHDQIRMAAIGNAALRLVGSHAGISIGADGPSQMALEDIGMMRALPDSVVLYPSDAVSAYKLTELMYGYNNGISYLRTTRMATPVLYDADASFAIGGCTVLREYAQAQACIIGAGVTLHEALKAHDNLAKQGIKVAVIDLYSIKPLDVKTIIRVAHASNKRIITVEDHYQAGGLGEAVAAALADTDIRVNILAVQQLPRSGKPEELLAWAGIDAAALTKAVFRQA